MSDQFLGEIRIFGYNFPPRGWAMCNGQLLPISQNTALFSLLGTFYGGDGKSNFALPNMQGNVPVGSGQGAGLSDYVLGETTGSATVTLLQSELPQHAHGLNADTSTGTSANPSGALISVPAINPRQPHAMYSSSSANSAMLAGNLLPTGGSQPHNNLQPYLVVNFCVAMQGIFPARN